MVSYLLSIAQRINFLHQGSNSNAESLRSPALRPFHEMKKAACGMAAGCKRVMASWISVRAVSHPKASTPNAAEKPDAIAYAERKAHAIRVVLHYGTEPQAWLRYARQEHCVLPAVLLQLRGSLLPHD